MSARSIFVISDLHLGGAPPEPHFVGADEVETQRRRRGFRMMTHTKELASFVRKLIDVPRAELVINGDFVDFLAEAKDDGSFVPFIADETEAIRVLRRVAGWVDASGKTQCEAGREAWDPLVFDALRAYLAAGKQLTILLGNHDLELCFPRVREELIRRLGGGELHFRYDNEALTFGRSVLVEHGNLYDRSNYVDHDALRKHRAEVTRGLRSSAFEAPVGSRIVAEIMNPIKTTYGFIDLLKPESEPLFTLLVALDPNARDKLSKLVSTLGGIPVDGVPARRGVSEERSASAGSRAAARPRPAVRGGRSGSRVAKDALGEVLGQVLGPKADAFERGLEGTEVAPTKPAKRGAGDALARALGLLKLVVGGKWVGSQGRLDALRTALGALHSDTSFNVDGDRGVYAEWAEKAGLAGGFGCVVFGHTHHAKDQTSKGTRPVRYLNTGTWANLMRFPDFYDDPYNVELEAFVEKVRMNDIGEYIRFMPTYARLELDEDDVLIAKDSGVFVADEQGDVVNDRRFEGWK